MVETLVLNNGDSELAEVKKARWLGRMFVRIGAPAIVLLNISIQAITQTITQTAKQGFHLWFIAMWMGILGVTIAACGYALWRTSAQWYLIPGGVIVRRTFWKNVGTKLERFIPADTLLTLAPDNIGWVASPVSRRPRDPPSPIDPHGGDRPAGVMAKPDPAALR